jgi:DNA replication protein DnaC
MLAEQTHEKLVGMKLRGMAEGLRQFLDEPNPDKLTFEERLGLLVDREWDERERRRLTRRLQMAKLREAACLEDVNYEHPRNLDRAMIQRLATCQWIERHENVTITGPTGLGKSWIACALANHACRQGSTSLYRRVPRLLHEMQIARADGTYVKELARIAKVDLLILDDWGLSVLEESERRDILEIIEDRDGRKSTLVTSQLAVKAWHDTIGDLTIADAIMDRLVHRAHRIELRGRSMRKEKKPSDSKARR